MSLLVRCNGPHGEGQDPSEQASPQTGENCPTPWLVISEITCREMYRRCPTTAPGQVATSRWTCSMGHPTGLGSSLGSPRTATYDVLM